MKVTLQVDGDEMTFTEEELSAIVEEHFSRLKEVPFKVNPLGINRSIFERERKNKKQEEIRQLIQVAFKVVDECPERYGKPFETLQPEKTWLWKTIDELVEVAENQGDHIANWVEQTLEWAQKIQNGETWEKICNKPDTAKWCRLVEWNKADFTLVGGSRVSSAYDPPAASVYSISSEADYWSAFTVPLVVSYR